MYLSLYIYIYINKERERETCVLSKGFEPGFFPLKYQHPTFEYKIHSVEVDLYYFKYLEPKIKCFEYFLPMHQVEKNGRPK